MVNILLIVLAILLTPNSQRLPVNVGAGDFHVKAGNHAMFIFTCPQACVLQGMIQVQRNPSYDIDMFVTDYDNYEKFVNRKEFAVFQGTGRVTLKKIEWKLGPGEHYLVLDNRYSLITNKTVSVYLDAVSAK